MEEEPIMRIIPKKTKVAIEFFKGIELLDVLVGLVGISIATALFVSNIPNRMWLVLVDIIVFVALIVPLDDEKGYMMLYNAAKYLARYKKFVKHEETDLSGTGKAGTGKADEGGKTASRPGTAKILHASPRAADCKLCKIPIMPA